MDCRDRIHVGYMGRGSYLSTERAVCPGALNFSELTIEHSVTKSPRESFMRASAIREGSSTTRAARIIAPRRAIDERGETPDPRADEVRFPLEGCGVCASNLGPPTEPSFLSFPVDRPEATRFLDAVKLPDDAETSGR